MDALRDRDIEIETAFYKEGWKHRQLARALHVVPQTVVRVLARLEARRQQNAPE